MQSQDRALHYSASRGKKGNVPNLQKNKSEVRGSCQVLRVLWRGRMVSFEVKFKQVKCPLFQHTL